MHWHRDTGEILALDVANTNAEFNLNLTLIYISTIAKIPKHDLLKFTQRMKINGLTFPKCFIALSGLEHNSYNTFLLKYQDPPKSFMVK